MAFVILPPVKPCPWRERDPPSWVGKFRKKQLLFIRDHHMPRDFTSDSYPFSRYRGGEGAIPEVPFHLFYGDGPPHTALGHLGDVYINIDVNNIDVWYRSQATWNLFEWPEDRRRENLGTKESYQDAVSRMRSRHPYLSDRYLWISLGTHPVMWLSLDQAKGRAEYNGFQGPAAYRERTTSIIGAQLVAKGFAKLGATYRYLFSTIACPDICLGVRSTPCWL